MPITLLEFQQNKTGRVQAKFGVDADSEAADLPTENLSSFGFENCPLSPWSTAIVGATKDVYWLTADFVWSKMGG